MYHLIGIPIIIKNLNANLVECAYQTLNSIICLHDIENRILDNKEPFIDILFACAWAMRSTVHTTLKASPAQVVFGRDMLFDLSFKVHWKDLLDNRKRVLLQNNEREFRSHKDYM